MTPEELLRLYPRETLRWLRRRLGLSQLRLTVEIAAHSGSVGTWEAGRHGISGEPRAQLAALLAPHLATQEGEEFARSLGRGEVSEG